MEKDQVKIFTRNNSPRLKYIAGILVGDILGLPWEVITDRRKLGKHPVINYSSEKISGSLRIDPFPLLFESGIRQVEISVSNWKNLPVFFQATPESDFPFDIFAASFYLVARYEEYLDFKPDEFGRFSASSSLAYKNGFLGIPVVDLWAKELSKALIRKYPVLAFKRNEFKALLTIDADEPFAYLGKNVIRSFGGLLRDLTVNPGHAGDRYKVVTHEKKDPYQVFDYITETIRKSSIETKFFFPMGDHSKYDKNPSWKNDEYRSLINSIASEFSVGLHPSYYAANDHSLVESELLHLKTIVSKNIVASRFHYIRLMTPSSYLNISHAGITEDYSMGYAEEPGFRAGIGRPYPFYNVKDDSLTGLKIIPFQVMDCTLYQYKKLDPGASLDIILNLIAETRAAGGLFASIWHNTSLLESPEWKEWRMVFETMLQNLHK
jgi:hypothetical protein